MRRAAVVKVQIARRELGLDEEVYRSILQRVTGEASATTCTDAQLGRVLDELKAKGWTPKTAPARKPSSRRAASPLARKARALWISLHQLGAIDDPSENALEAFARRQLGVDRMAWADAAKADALIEALKAMAERAGWRQDVRGVPAHLRVEVLKERLAEAIAARAAR